MQDAELEYRLKAVVDAYGASPERWPVAERAALERAAAGFDRADWLNEARALDALLDSSRCDGMPAGLAGRIVAAARDTAQDRAGTNVVPMRRTAVRRPASGRLARLPEAALLAASLLAGIWFGGSGVLDSVLTDVELSIATVTETEDEVNFYEALDGFAVTDAGDLL